MIALVTGATSGIGREAASRLAALGADLVLIGRNEQAGNSLARRLSGRAASRRIDFLRADLSRQSDVRALADRVNRNHESVDVLINNAGGRYDSYAVNPDGIELTFATNHLGHFLLTNLLLPALMRAPAARVITVSSGSHHAARPDRGWYSGPDEYDRRLAYANSKLANVMFAYELARRLQGTRVTSNAVDPGGVASRFAKNNGLYPWIRHLAAHAIRRDLVSPRSAAEAIVHVATSEEFRNVTGRFFRRGRAAASSAASHDIEEARRLWKMSAALTGLDIETAARACTQARTSEG